jgi:protein phosphatase
MRTVEIPDPSLVLLVGAAGAGKSTLAARLFEPDEVLSSDAFRERISGDAADQRATRAAFDQLHRALVARLETGRLTVLDATNLERSARRASLVRARAAGVPIVAIVLDLPAAVVLARNAGRSERVVDRAVVGRHLAALRSTVDGGQLAAEGYDAVVLLGSPEAVDELRIERRPTSAGSPGRP